jgi:hypothetical protein
MGDLDHNENCNNTVEHYCNTSEKLSRLNVFIQSMDVYINHIWGFLQVSRFCSPMCMPLSWSSTKVCMVCTQTLVHWNILHFQKSCKDKRSHLLINEVSNFKSQSSKKVRRKCWNSNHDLLHFQKLCKDKTSLVLISEVMKFESRSLAFSKFT